RSAFIVSCYQTIDYHSCFFSLSSLAVSYSNMCTTSN
uniref:Uncharacterized protein n=1 Tax=Amphimedon queenslandica TaxID=400682 RepID=A0A1X7VPX5_AMPQE